MQSLRCQRAFAAGPQRVQPSSRGVLQIVCKESRIGSKPIPVPKGVTVDIKGLDVRVKGPKGELSLTLTPLVEIKQENEKLVLARTQQTKVASAMHGLSRSLTANMVTGVSTGFTKNMEMVGTGYRASVSGKELTLNVGYNKPRVLGIPDGVTVKVEKSTALEINGVDRVVLGDFCALIRRQREPEPYKGKGIRYKGEIIKLKEGKSGGKKK